MNQTILNKVTSSFNAPINKENEQNPPRINSPKLKQLEKDTVSFSAKPSTKKIQHFSLDILKAIPFSEKTQSLRAEAERIYNFGKSKLSEFNDLCLDIFPNGAKTTRIKSPNSIESKLRNKIKQNPTRDKNLMNIIGDLAGARGITDGSQEATDKIVKNLVKKIEEKELQITSIRNYRGTYTEPYFCQKHIDLITEANRKAGNKNIKILDGTNAIKENGYTAGHITVITKDKLNVELQIKGKLVNKIDESTHIIHDLFVAKDSACINSRSKRKLLEPVIKAYNSLSPAKKDKYNKYLNACYLEARKAEINNKKLVLPQLINEIPDCLNLDKLWDVAQQFKLY